MGSPRVTAYPTTLIIDRAGRLRYRRIGYVEKLAQGLEIPVDEPVR